MQLLLQGLKSPSMRNLRSSISQGREGPLVSAIPWSSGSFSDGVAIVELFHEQLLHTLNDNREMRDAFRPFVRPRTWKSLAFRPGAYPSVVAPHKYQVPEVPPWCDRLANAHLRDYQRVGVETLLGNFHRGVCCILADEMGLGKTAQICCFLAALSVMHGIAGNFLILVPLTSLASWGRELATWAPNLVVFKLHGTSISREATKRLIRGSRPSFVVLTTYDTAKCERKFFNRHMWSVLVVDEAHQLKNGNSLISRVCSKFSAAFRVAVTGTPVQNGSSEVWSLMQFLYPKLSHKCTFRDGDADKAVDQCSALLAYIMLRRTKASVDVGLPPKRHSVLPLAPTAVQARLMSTLLDRSSGAKTRTQIVNIFMQLRKVCNHPQMLRIIAHREGAEMELTPEVPTLGLRRLCHCGVRLCHEDIIALSGKMIALDQLMCNEFLPGHHKVIIFSLFTSMLDILEGYCVLRKFPYERLDGDSSRVERELAMLRFNYSPKSFVFLATTTAGGIGISLTAADRVILYDSHFNPQVDRQAADRAHRIGQTRPVEIVSLILHGTVEERILERSRQKAIHSDLVVDGTAADIPFSTEEIWEACLSTCLNGTRDGSPEHVESMCSALESMLNRKTRREYGARQQLRVLLQREERCFICSLSRPTHHCNRCVKVFHASCLSQTAKTREHGNHWTCPRHFCSTCGVYEVEAIFCCTTCPLSFCMDCLPPQFLDFHSAELVSPFYEGMELAGMPVRRSMFYIRCDDCLAHSCHRKAPGKRQDSTISVDDAEFSTESTLSFDSTLSPPSTSSDSTLEFSSCSASGSDAD